VTHERRDPFAEIEARRIGEWRNLLVAEPELLECAATPTELPSPACAPPSIERRQWPKPLAEQAFQGVAGEIVRTVEPHTEADPSALLFQFLGGFGTSLDVAPTRLLTGPDMDATCSLQSLASARKGERVQRGTTYGAF
jgi:hypothetical protein